LTAYTALALSCLPAYNFIVKVYIETKDLSSFSNFAVLPYSSIEETAMEMQKRYFNDHPAYTILRTQNGKPYFAHTDTLFFSGSHTKNYCITVMAEKDIAVDIEQCRSKRFHSIAEYAFTATEQKQLAQSRAIEKDFFLLWTIKEADIKLHGGSVFSIQDAVHLNLSEKTAVSGSLHKHTTQCAPSIAGEALHSGTTSEEDTPADNTAYPHSIFSFYLTLASAKQPVHFVTSIIIAGQHTDVAFEWHESAAQHSLMSVEQFFVYPARKA